MERAWNCSPTFLMVTGAARGLGQSFAIALSKELTVDSVVVLTDLNIDGLEDTRGKIDNNITVDLVQMDHGSDSAKDFLGLFGKFKDRNFKSAVLINNVGIISEIGVTVKDYDNEEVIGKFLRVNYTSPCLTTAAFLQFFEGDVRKTVVNVTSLCAVKPLPTLANYCSVKAARNMYFRVLAEEFPEVRVLSFAPGAVDTPFFGNINDRDTHKETIALLKKKLANITRLKPSQVAERLLGLLKKDAFQSGAHIDYHDTD